jgi:integrase
VNGSLSLVSPKSNKERKVPLPELSKKLIAPLILSTEPGCGIFRSPQGGHLRHSNFMRRVFEPALEVAGIADFTFHELRHTAVSQLIASGADIVTISKIIGHSNPSVTLNVYSHLLPDAFDQVRMAMDANFGDTWENKVIGDSL